MKRTVAIAAVTVLTTLSVSGTAHADVPFGFERDIHPSQYGYCSETATDAFYTCSTSPKPHSAFGYYLVYYMDGIGLCKVVGVGKDIENDRYGGKSRDIADEIAQQIEKKYGAHTAKLDFLSSGSLWDEPKYWMTGIDAEDRYYIYYWLEGEGYKKVADVTAISVAVRASGSRTGYVTAGFEFSALSRCVSAKDDADSGAF